MATIHSWADMRQYGVELLTGESCGIGMRGLFDLTPSGVDLIEGFLSIQIKRGNGWNNQRPDAASIMMPYSLLQPLAVYTLLRFGAEIVVVVDHSAKSYSSHFIEAVKVDDWEEWRKTAQVLYPDSYTIYRTSGNAAGGLRHQHYMSGRVE